MTGAEVVATIKREARAAGLPVGAVDAWVWEFFEGLVDRRGMERDVLEMGRLSIADAVAKRSA